MHSAANVPPARPLSALTPALIGPAVVAAPPAQYYVVVPSQDPAVPGAYYFPAAAAPGGGAPPPGAVAMPQYAYQQQPVPSPSQASRPGPARPGSA